MINIATAHGRYLPHFNQNRLIILHQLIHITKDRTFTSWHDRLFSYAPVIAYITHLLFLIGRNITSSSINRSMPSTKMIDLYCLLSYNSPDWCLRQEFNHFWNSLHYLKKWLHMQTLPSHPLKWHLTNYTFILANRFQFLFWL